MSLKCVWIDDKLICDFDGRQDTVSCNAIAEEFKTHLAEFEEKNGSEIVFDMTGVDYVASSFLRFCVNAAKLGKDGFKVVNVTHPVKKVFKIAGLGDCLE